MLAIVSSALFGLLGVLLGAGLSLVGTAWSDRTRHHHERVLLARKEKVEAYGAFSAATKEYVAVLYRVAGGLGLDSQTEALSLEAAEPLLARAFHSRDAAFEQMRLLGSDDSIAKAREWVQAIYRMRERLSSQGLGVEDWLTLVARANVARDAFHAQARSELALD